MYSKYQEAINRQLHLVPEEWNFKSDSDYTYILEHCDEYQGYQYLELIKCHFAEFYERHLSVLKTTCGLNDKYGKTHKYVIGDFMTCSPTNLRYILHSLLILRDIKEYQLNDVDIIEIGGGYGGLCLFMHNIAPLYGINIRSYTIFDLPEASRLQDKYLTALNVQNVQLNNYTNLNKNSFLISNYAFSEISKELQKEYIDKIINPYTAFGFLTWNCIPIYNFAENSIIKTEIEYPQTGGDINYYVRYYPK
jgi:hypothetical protein